MTGTKPKGKEPKHTCECGKQFNTDAAWDIHKHSTGHKENKKK